MSESGEMKEDQWQLSTMVVIYNESQCFRLICDLPIGLRNVPGKWVS